MEKGQSEKVKKAMGGGQWSVVSGRWSVVGGPGVGSPHVSKGAVDGEGALTNVRATDTLRLLFRASLAAHHFGEPRKQNSTSLEVSYFLISWIARNFSTN